MSKAIGVMTALLVLCQCAAGRADVLRMNSGLTSLETVVVGDPGNAANTFGDGSVDYVYRMGRFEVTAGQYCEFLNAKAKSDPYGLYSAEMVSAFGCNIQRSGDDGGYTYGIASDWADRPVNYVSYWDACRFANWLNNGQGQSDTEHGTYTLNGYNGSLGGNIRRNPGALWYIPDSNEWFKAAYYKGGSINAGYWQYATQSNSLPDNTLGATEGANYFDGSYTIGEPYYRTEAGEFASSPSPYGTFDQAGNVWEWYDYVTSFPGYMDWRSVWGGSFCDNAYGLSAGNGGCGDPTGEFSYVGFRVAQASSPEVPEPPSMAAMFGGLACLGARLKRRR